MAFPTGAWGEFYLVSFCAARGYLSADGRGNFHFEMVGTGHFTSTSSFYMELGNWVGPQDISIDNCIHQRLPVILGGGGGVLFDRFWHVPLIKRSGDAPTNPEKWTIPTGRFDTIEELVNPDLMIRELWEELITSQGKLIVNLQDIVGIINSNNKGEEFPVNHMMISCDGSDSHFYGWLSLNNSGELNTIVPVLADVDLTKYHFVDGECDDDGNRLEREVVLYQLKKKDVICELPMTEHAMVAIENISKGCYLAAANKKGDT